MDLENAINGCPPDPFVQEKFEEWWDRGVINLLTQKKYIKKLTAYPIPESPFDDVCDKRVLEIGCNWGRWCISIARKGGRPIGVDKSFPAVQAALRVARQMNLSILYLVADAENLPFKKGVFDCVFSYNVFEYLNKEVTVKVLQEIRNVLSDAGISLIEISNSCGIRNLFHQLMRGFNPPASTSIHCEYYWKIPEIRQMFQGAIGPTVLRSQGYLCLNPQTSDVPFLPFWDRMIVCFSNALVRLSKRVRWIICFADSLYAKSCGGKP